VVGYLKDFQFDPSKVHHAVGTLSGGQKNRLMLAKILANPKTCLILDEPTNDLDMDTLDMLEDILVQYKGTLIIVSHDRDFLDQTVTKILAFEGDGIVDGVVGGYSDYLEKMQKEKKAEKKESASPTKKEIKEEIIDSKQPSKKLTFKLQHELDTLPARIKSLEADIESLSLALEDPDYYTNDPQSFLKTSEALEQARANLEVCETRWLELEEIRAAS
jgi:ATP-binding cassette subfamily F protein uup